VQQITRALNVRSDERLAERTRIAQDLYDTLLQGFLSASMQLHLAVDELPEDSPGRMRLDGILRLMGQVTEEGRKVLQGLGSSDVDAERLEQALAGICHQLDVRDGIDYTVTVEGAARCLHPIIRDEVYRVAREAVVSAFRHAHARAVEVTIEYSAKALRVLVRDDGRGIDSRVLASWREGSGGLSGMRQRAERIGARLRVRSRSGAGTEVELSVPGWVAFQARPSAGQSREESR
jgi:signal transduction histidine kinase